MATAILQPKAECSRTRRGPGDGEQCGSELPRGERSNGVSRPGFPGSVDAPAITAAADGAGFGGIDLNGAHDRQQRDDHRTGAAAAEQRNTPEHSSADYTAAEQCAALSTAEQRGADQPAADIGGAEQQPANYAPAEHGAPEHSSAELGTAGVIATSTVSEQEKYVGIYSDPETYPTYGHSNHGEGARKILKGWCFQSLLDVGCGHNQFVRGIQQWLKCVRAIGVDFACPSADVRADARELPFCDLAFDVVTAFDVLEHVREEDVDAVLRELARVAKVFVFSISYQPSRITWHGLNLHPTVRDEAWWMERIRAVGAVSLEKNGRYLVGAWDAGELIRNPPPPVAPGASCILVGNGPSVLRSKLGSVIDSFDEVVRFNVFHTKGFEEHAGSKTTLWSTGGFGMMTQPGRRPDRVIYIHGRNGIPAPGIKQMWRIPLEYYHERRKQVRAVSRLPEEQKDQLLPSSGFLLASWLLDHGVPCLTLVGFDHFKKDFSKRHHYWNGSDKVHSRPKEHDGDAEAELFAALMRAGRIQYLEPMNENTESTIPGEAPPAAAAAPLEPSAPAPSPAPEAQPERKPQPPAPARHQDERKAAAIARFLMHIRQRVSEARQAGNAALLQPFAGLTRDGEEIRASGPEDEVRKSVFDWCEENGMKVDRDRDVISL